MRPVHRHLRRLCICLWLAVLPVTRLAAQANLPATKLEAAQKAADEGEQFLKLTQDLEHGGEIAHSDLIKAKLQVNERRRQLQEAQLALLSARMDLAILIFPGFEDNFELADDLHASPVLPTFFEVAAQAAQQIADFKVQRGSHQQSFRGCRCLERR
jgi:outer membrane protein TolC